MGGQTICEQLRKDIQRNQPYVVPKILAKFSLNGRCKECEEKPKAGPRHEKQAMQYHFIDKHWPVRIPFYAVPPNSIPL